MKRRFLVCLLLMVAGLGGCGQSHTHDGATEPGTPRSSGTLPTATESPTSAPLPDVPGVFVAESAGTIAAFDSADGHMLRVLTSPPPGQVDRLPRLGLDQSNRRVVYFVRGHTHNSCSDSIWKVAPAGGRAVRVFGQGKFWIRGLAADPSAESLAFSAEDCARGANASGVYLLTPPGTVRGHISESVPPDSNGIPGAGSLALAGDSLAIFVGYHNAPWIAIAHPSGLGSRPRLVDVPRSGLPPKLPTGSTYCSTVVGPPLWLRPGELASTDTCYRGTSGRTAHVDSTLLVTLGSSGQRRGVLLAKVAGARINVDLLSTDNRGHVIGTVGKESDDTQYVMQVIEVSGTKQHLLPPCDIRTLGCPANPAW